jgi:hypothetical protein
MKKARKRRKMTKAERTRYARGRAALARWRKPTGLEITIKYSGRSEEEAVLRVLEEIRSKFPRVSVRRV